MKRKGQLTFDGILMGFLLLTVYIALLPALNEMISTGLGITSGMTAVILTLFPLFMLLGILRGIWGYSSFQQG